MFSRQCSAHDRQLLRLLLAARCDELERRLALIEGELFLAAPDHCRSFIIRRELKALVEIEREDWTHKMQRLLRRACHATNLARIAGRSAAAGSHHADRAMFRRDPRRRPGVPSGWRSIRHSPLLRAVGKGKARGRRGGSIILCCCAWVSARGSRQLRLLTDLIRAGPSPTISRNAMVG